MPDARLSLIWLPSTSGSWPLGWAIRSSPDCYTRVFGGELVVTSVPYHCSILEKYFWLDRGLTVRRQRRLDWLVLHHVPPSTAPGCSGDESEAADLLLEYRPDYFVSGHRHQYPYLSGTNWSQRISGVLVLVPGQLLRAPFPNHIILDTDSKQASWETSNREWIPEVGLYNHRLLVSSDGSKDCGD